MKKYSLIIFLLILSKLGKTCPVCERNQPKLLRGILHGSGPEDKWDYLIVWTMVMITICTLYYAFKWLIRPGEKNINHIKYSILQNTENED